MKTGAELKARREELKMKQQDLADKIGVSRPQLSKIENGKKEIKDWVRKRIEDVLYAESEILKFSDLEVGDYVYVRDDLVEFEDYGCTYYVDEIGSGIQQIGSFHSKYPQFKTNKSIYWVTPEMLDLSRSMKKEDYLKMNDKEYASFEELQYVANKALDESIIEKYEVCIGHYGNKNMIIHFDGKFTEYSDNSTNSGVEFIQSLYTEEFVINEYEDLKKINLKSSKVKFLNGFETEIIGVDWQQDGGNISLYDGEFYIDFNILKGATVKQSKGDK